ncbi:MAG: asparagine synthase-related protein [Bdellovibrionia bacterium]
MQWGNFYFSTQSPTFENEDFALFCEGPIFRFFDTTISLNPENIFASVVELFQEKGRNFYRHIDGLHLLFFWDKKQDEYYIVTNPQQSHRLYFTPFQQKLFVGTSLKNLLNLSKIPREIYFPSVRSFLANGFIQSEKTPLKGVERLQAADVLMIQGSNISGYKKISYWDQQFSKHRTEFADLKQHLDLYEETYRQGIKRFFKSTGLPQKEVGCLLSGGHDTSWLVAQLTQVSPKPVHAFTVTFPGWNFDEGQCAENIAKKFGAQFHPIPFSAEHLDLTIDLIKANEEPVVGSALPLHLLAQQAKEHVSVIFGGDAGDTMWGEYYPVAEYHKWVKSIPTFIRRLLFYVAKFLRRLTDWERFWELEHVASLFADKNYHDDFLRKLCTYRHFSDEFQNALLIDSLAQEPFSRAQNEIKFTDQNFSEALIEGKLLNGFYTYQAFSQSRSIESMDMPFVLPTTQRDLIKFITALPMKWINGGNTFQRLTNNKQINRKFHKMALSRYLKKHEIYNRSFDIPWYNIFKPRKELLENLKLALLRRGWYKAETIENLFNEFEKQKVKKHELLELKHHGYRIFTLLSLEVWCREFLDSRTSVRNTQTKLEEYLRD